MTFRNLIEKSGEGKRVQFREDGKATSTGDNFSNTMADTKNIAGFVATKANPGEGYAVYLPNSSEMKEFGKDVLRLVWSKGTTIVKIDANKGKLIFLDNEAYEEGNLKWQSAMNYDRLVIDDTKNGNRLQEITGIV